MKKYLSLFLVLVMLMSSMPLSAIAEGEAQESAPAATEQAEQTQEKENTEEEAPEKEPEEEPAVQESEKKEEKAEEKAQQPEVQSAPAAVSEHTEEKSEEVTEEKTEEATEEKTEEATEEKTEEVTEEKTEEVTEEKTEEATEEKTEEKTEEVTEEKTEEATEEKTEEVTEEKNEEATEEQPAEPETPEEEADENAGKTEEPSEPTEGADGIEGETADSAEDGDAVTPENGSEEDNAAQEEQTAAVEGEQTEELGKVEAPELLAGPGDLEQVEGVSASTASATSVRLRWYHASTGDGYEIQRSTTENFAAGTYKQFTTTIDDSDLVFTGLTCGRTYYYRVRVYQTTGGETYRGPWSKVVSMRTSPSAPSWIDAEAVSANSVKLSWPKVSEASGYIVMRDGSEIYRTGSNSTLSYKDSGLMTGTRYDYRVYSYKTVDDEPIQSEEYAQYTDPIDGETGYTVVPPAPKGLSTKSAGLASITVTWKKVDNVDGYNIYRAVASTENFERWGSVSGADTLSYTDSRDIATGDEYRYYVTAYVGGVESKPSEIIAGKARPEAPKNLTATYVNSSSIRVNWSAVSGARGYILEVSDDKAFSAPAILMVDSDTSYLDEGLAVGQERFYRVRAYVREYGSGHVESDNSITAWEMTRPLAPTNLKLTSTAHNKIKVSWSRPEGADGYQVYRSTDGTNWTLIKTYDSTSSAPYVTSVNLTCGQRYYYRVRAFVYSSDGVSRYPGPYSAVESTIAKPAAPASVVANRVSGKNAFTVAWSAVSGVDGYRIYYKQNGSAAVYVKSVRSAVLSTTVSGLEAGYTYQFIVIPYRMVDDARVNGAQENADPKMLPIDQPTNLKRSALTTTSVKVSWDAIGGVDGYDVKVVGEDDPTFTPYETSVTTNSVTVENLITGYNYVATVRAYSVIDGEKKYGSWSNPYTIWASATTPTGLSARTLYDAQGIHLSWDKVDGATGYIIMRSESANSGYSQLVKLEGSGITQYDDMMELYQIGTKYYYTICSYTDAIGSKTSPYTVAVSATAKLPRPTLTLGNAGVSRAKINWTLIDGADGYALYRSTSADGTYSQIATFDDGSKTSCTATGLTTGQTYYFRVAAYKYVGGTKVYGTRSLAESIVPSPIAVTGLTGTAYAQSVKLTWDKVTGVSGYRVFRATGTGSYQAVADVTGTTFTDTDLICGQTYRYRVAAYMDVSSGRAVGAASSSISITTAVTKTQNLKFTVTGATKVYMTWTAVRDADGYQIQRATSETGEYTTIGDVKNNYCTISGMPTGQYRYIRIRAYVEEDGVRKYCSTWSDVKKTVSRPLAVSDLAITGKTKSSLSVNWTKAAGATGYKIYYKKASASSYTLAATIEGDVTAYRVSGLSSGTKYNIKIVATCKDSNGATLNSNKSAVITATTN